MVDSLLTPHPFETLRERLVLTGAFLTIPKKTYVRATGWDGTHPQLSYERILGDKSWVALEVPCGHDVMLDMPRQLAELLLQAEERKP